MPKSELLQLDPDSQAFVDWLTRDGFRAPEATVLHNTWSPTAAQYRGRKTIRGIERFHMEARGFSTIAANGYACPDGTIITARDLSYDNWAHALISRHDVEAEARAVSHGDKQWFNHHAYGLETVANFDQERPYGPGLGGQSFKTAMRVLMVVHLTFGLPARALYFHRDVADKTCPGLMLSRLMVRAELAMRLGETPRTPKVIDQRAPAGAEIAVIDCDAELRVDGQTWVDAQKLLRGLGLAGDAQGMQPIRAVLAPFPLGLVPHIKDQGKIYIILR